MMKKTSILLIFTVTQLSFLSTAHATSVLSLSKQTWSNYRSFVKVSIQSGLASSDDVRLNIYYAEKALRDWTLACRKRDQKKLLKIIQYGETSLKAQLPYGIDFFAQDLKNRLDIAKVRVRANQCEQVIEPASWIKELRQLKEDIK